MTAATLSATPVTDALIAIIDDALAWREPGTTGCCKASDMCGDHQADQDRADAMGQLLTAIQTAGYDEAALLVLAIAPHGLLARITGGDRDDV